MIRFGKGNYVAYETCDPADIASAQALRARCFGVSCDTDIFDAYATHILVRRIKDDRLVCCFRLIPVTGATLERSYSAQFYELSALATFQGKMVEMGRFCVDPLHADPDVLRVAWGAMTFFVDTGDVELLFGCTSFAGTQTSDYLDAFALLQERHLAPARWLPRVKAPKVFSFAQRLRTAPDFKSAMRRMPPLLKTYLMMGGWVSDHAVIDDALNTLHVFTGVEIGSIPAARKRALRAVVG